MTQLLTMPELPVRDLSWYKTRYEGLREDVVRQTHIIEGLEIENKSYKKYVDSMQRQLDSAKELIDLLWEVNDDLSPNKLTRIEHDE